MSHTKNTSKKGTKDKASSRDAGAVAAQIRAVLESSQVKGTVKRRLNELIGKLHEDFGGRRRERAPGVSAAGVRTGGGGPALRREAQGSLRRGAGRLRRNRTPG